MPTDATIDPTLMIEPAPASRIPGKNDWASTIGASRFTASVRRTSSSDSSSALTPATMYAALFTRTSIRPSNSSRHALGDRDDLGPLREVGGHAHEPARRRGLLVELGRAPGDGRHPGAREHERPREAVADAGTRAGDHGVLAGQVEELRGLSSDDVQLQSPVSPRRPARRTRCTRVAASPKGNRRIGTLTREIHDNVVSSQKPMAPCSWWVDVEHDVGRLQRSRPAGRGRRRALRGDASRRSRARTWPAPPGRPARLRHR